ncbi:predicted protein [Naegleria gruberi]|uniref:Predicted protein n=1 Tax=Naegleria gruberi TaxID=5762 RepID=D2W4L2_NAEGR|nr:uncharacterized protein NAEGRDRAFT_76346 [Naegleria gruberi]EFC35991.1 predicted protein [Naegleria gruberi]|eukprot:XP_002668735.1 predicted protein [Naegleria gruberi strain NEG-M]
MIAVMLPNLPLFPVLFHGISYVGGIVTTLNPLYSYEEIQSQLADSGAIMMITSKDFLEKAQKSIENTKVKQLFVLDLKDEIVENVLKVEETLLKESVRTEMINTVSFNTKEDVFAVPYSSGTVGLCKGVCLTHFNTLSNILQFRCSVEKISSGDCTIAVLPFFHIYGLTLICNAALYEGAKVVTMARFDLETFLRNIQTHQVTRIHLVPPIMIALAKHPLIEKYNLTSIKTLVSAAAPLSAEVASMVSKRLNVIVKQGYGLTETGPVCCVCPDDNVKVGSVGLLLPLTDLKILDLETEEEITQVGKQGELCFSGPQMMKGYLNNEEATKYTLRNGFIHTGDVGYIDSDGFLYIVDRVKELIKYNGYQVPPAELEGILLKHPKILDAAVIGIQDETVGELPKAFVVMRPNETLSEDEVMNFVAEHVSPQRRVRLVEFVKEIPKSSSGKILRRLLRQR